MLLLYFLKVLAAHSLVIIVFCSLAQSSYVWHYVKIWWHCPYCCELLSDVQIRLVIFSEHELIRARCQQAHDVTSLTRCPISACVKLMMSNDVAHGRQRDVINNSCVRRPAPLSGITEVKAKIKRMKVGDSIMRSVCSEKEILFHF